MAENTKQAPAPEKHDPKTPAPEGLEAIQSLMEKGGDTGLAAEALAVAVNGKQTSHAAVEEIALLDFTGAKALVAEAAEAKISDPTIAAKWLRKKYPERRVQIEN